MIPTTIPRNDPSMMVMRSPIGILSHLELNDSNCRTTMVPSPAPAMSPRSPMAKGLIGVWGISEGGSVSPDLEAGFGSLSSDVEVVVSSAG